METFSKSMTKKKDNGSLNVYVYRSKQRENFFIIHSAGPINRETSPILQKQVDRLMESNPGMILFDLKRVNYINGSGLRVILKTIMEMELRSGKVYLTNLQPHIKDMFEIMNGTLPEWVIKNREQLRAIMMK